MSYLAEFEQAQADQRAELRQLASRVNRFNAELLSLLQTFTNDGALGQGVIATTTEEASEGCIANIIDGDRNYSVNCRVTANLGQLGYSMILTPSGENATSRMRAIAFNEDDDVMIALMQTMRALGKLSVVEAK